MIFKIYLVFAIKENLYENCFSKNGNIKNEYAVDVELNFELNEIYIKNQYKYLGNEGNCVTQYKKMQNLYFNF